MCMFARPVVSVADTRIFVHMTGPGRQLLVYEMSYAAADDLAMILPLPVASRDEETAVKFIDLSPLPDFFNLLDQLIQLPPEWISIGSGNLLSEFGEEVRPPLKVREVGAFDASFVPSLADFDRLDARFRLPDNVWAKLPQHADYGFAVFKLRETGKSLKHVHPMAFEFLTRLTDTLFIPTVHVHDGQVHPQAWFDHIVYLQGKSCNVSVAGEKCKSFMDGLLSELKQLAKGSSEYRRKFVELYQQNPQTSRPMRAGARPCYYLDGNQLSEADVDRHWSTIQPWQPLDWKLLRQREAKGDRFGVVWPVGPKTKDLRFQELAPILDPSSDLYAVGMSGLLPNADTLIGVGSP